ncbi:uncharacterized protein LOC119662166 [Teleopsis dalmanni]|uniref:uncharacterized protein LOC119662166 n=1 Tax=Teleopsis dalmanni TaxID=139649 RepID=UPI0018CF8387|nr:uncharacterized protein LOC119662166 [Teleopsis dalmanni]XP_037927653.1 uncharacterized protein LOC119662166 [Teleopsis dalmanni]XP_037927654.1 uncharacterized protein LOC119662166 [Teleopsis dalmanni]XP_037927655.1 uncharacterized protein LOC119662166 [Teleopsis dalmanni]
MGFHLNIKTDFTKALFVDIVHENNSCELSVRFLPNETQLTASATEIGDKVAVSNEEKGSVCFHATKSTNTVFEVKDTQPTHNKVSYNDINFQREKGIQSLYVRASKSANVIYEMDDLVCTKDTMRSNYILFNSKEFQSNNRKQSLNMCRSKSDSEIFNMKDREDHEKGSKQSLRLRVSKSESTMFNKKNSKNTKYSERIDDNTLQSCDDRPGLSKIRKRSLYLCMSKSTSAISDMIDSKYISLEHKNKMNAHDGLDFEMKKWQRSLYLNKSKSSNALFGIKDFEYRNEKAFCGSITCQSKAEKLFRLDDSKSRNIIAEAKDPKHLDNTLFADTFSKANKLLYLRSTKSIDSRINIKGFEQVIKSALCYNLYKQTEQEEKRLHYLNIRKIINNSHEPKNRKCADNEYEAEEKESLYTNANMATSTAFENKDFECFNNTDSETEGGRNKYLAPTSNEVFECLNNNHESKNLECLINNNDNEYKVEEKESLCPNANVATSTAFENKDFECFNNTDSKAEGGRTKYLAPTSNEDSECLNNKQCRIEEQEKASLSSNANHVTSTAIKNEDSGCVNITKHQAKNFKKSHDVSHLIRIDTLMSVLSIPDNIVVGQKNINNEKNTEHLDKSQSLKVSPDVSIETLNSTKNY